MRKQKMLHRILAAVCTAALLAGCGSAAGSSQNGAASGQEDASQKSGESDSTLQNTAEETSDHPVITMNAPYRNMSMFYDLVHEKYPEINLEITPYNGQNTTCYFQDMRLSGNLPDIYFSTIYSPGRYEDSEDLLDLSGYEFTSNYTQSRLREVTWNGGIYMLPLGYNALGITYNKTLLEKNGWSLPTSLKELEELKQKAEDAGYIFCRDQLQYPGYGFQYLCNIADTGFLSTTDGLAWQQKFIKGEATVKDTPEMVKTLELLDRWRELGMLNGEGTPDSDSDTKASMLEGNTLFLVGNSNDLSAEADSTDQYGLMPYLSEEGDQNVFVLNVSRYVGLNKKLGEAGNEQKLEDVLHVMEVLTTVEGMESLEPSQNNSRILPLKDANVSEDSYYADILDELNSGHTASFIYAGWENIVVALGEKMIDYVCGRASLDEVIQCFDENQHFLTDDSLDYYTTVQESIGLEDCARLVGISFAQATDSEAALISTNPWIHDSDVYEMNKQGVSGSLFPMPVSDEELVSILPTGWSGNISMVTLTGARIKELAEQGFDFNGDGKVFPYVLVTKGGKELDDDTVYTIPICGATEEVQEEGNLQNSGVMGLDAARTYVSQFETLSGKDIIWE